jgi:probable phosphoglycerate mutase
VTRDLDAGAAGRPDGRTIVVLRHGRTAWNAQGRAQGHADVGLDDVGHAQAAAAASYLATLDPVALWTSDLARAAETCAYLEKETGLVAVHDERLREFHVGLRQGMTIPEFADAHPQEHRAWVSGDDTRLPGAESPSDVETRMLPALCGSFEALEPGQTGVVVTHGASLKVGVVALLGWPRELAVSLRGMDNCAWATVEEAGAGGRIRMVGYNESVRPGHDAPQPLPDAC